MNLRNTNDTDDHFMIGLWREMEKQLKLIYEKAFKLFYLQRKHLLTLRISAISYIHTYMHMRQLVTV